ncbi:hypothetical protein B0T22DRAFT_160874 [Podospora appendiculata]|uniref:DUF7730 domain-containing protein n=1 Tax=Podospora appendiculata TaxID=314037 RepID=A0AAE0X9S6_9PEZI|nr:hypothetical protein B0T22DRAFT_160874 [Podospora appendiculata]
MQQNKERQRKIRHELHKSFPKPGSLEFELWDRNQRLSPLLRLPPELRNRIYELLLSVGQINVRYKRWEHRIRTDSSNSSSSSSNRSHNQRPLYDTIEGGFWCRLLAREQDPWQQQPPPAAHMHGTGMTLLSPVCRQLYHETALLPYSLNAWSFESAHVMERYVIKEKRLPLPQRRAIRLLYSQHVLTAHVEKFFGGLEVVLLTGGTRMTKRVIEADPENAGRRTVLWEVAHRWWE